MPPVKPGHGPAAALLKTAQRSALGMFAGLGGFLIAFALFAMSSDHAWYGRGPNVILPMAERESAFFTMYSLVIAAGVVLIAYSVLIPLRNKWAVYAGFPVVVVIGLLCLATAFASNFDILYLLGVLGGAAFLFFDLVWVLICDREARDEEEFEQLRAASGADPIQSLASLLAHPKLSVRQAAMRELQALGPTAGPAAMAPVVPELVRLLSKSFPPDPSRTDLCKTCGQALSAWTRDRVTSPEHPKGFPTCKPCFRRLVGGLPSEAQLAADVLVTLGPGAAPAIPALRKLAADSYEPLLKQACQKTLEILGASPPRSA